MQVRLAFLFLKRKFAIQMMVFCFKNYCFWWCFPAVIYTLVISYNDKID